MRIFSHHYSYATRADHFAVSSDRNGWFEDPRDWVAAIGRIVYASVGPTRISEEALASWRFKPTSIDIQG